LENIKKIKTKRARWLWLIPIIFIGFNVGFYKEERAEWVNDNHPYPAAKEYLVKANMCLAYGLLLTSLPFADEETFFVRSIIKLQHYFVEKAKEHIPDTDAEKEMYWYVFKHTYIIRKSKKVYLRHGYSYDQVREILDEMWPVIEGIAEKDLKDPEFIEMRFGAFGNLAYLYSVNEPIYWYDEKTKNVDMNKAYKDTGKTERIYKLFHYFLKIDSLYKTEYPKVYTRRGNVEIDNFTIHMLTKWILNHQISTNSYKKNRGFCDPGRNIYLQYYLASREFLFNELNEPDCTELTTAHIQKNILTPWIDKKIDRVCENLNLTKEETEDGR